MINVRPHPFGGFTFERGRAKADHILLSVNFALCTLPRCGGGQEKCSFKTRLFFEKINLSRKYPRNPNFSFRIEKCAFVCSGSFLCVHFLFFRLSFSFFAIFSFVHAILFRILFISNATVVLCFIKRRKETSWNPTRTRTTNKCIPTEMKLDK